MIWRIITLSQRVATDCAAQEQVTHLHNLFSIFSGPLSSHAFDTVVHPWSGQDIHSFWRVEALQSLATCKDENPFCSEEADFEIAIWLQTSNQNVFPWNSWEPNVHNDKGKALQRFTVLVMSNPSCKLHVWVIRYGTQPLNQNHYRDRMHNSRWSHSHQQQKNTTTTTTTTTNKGNKDKSKNKKRKDDSTNNHDTVSPRQVLLPVMGCNQYTLELPKVRGKAIFSTGWKLDELVIGHPEFIHIPWFHHGFIHWPNTETVNGTKCWCYWDAREDNSDCFSMAVDNACGHRPASPAFEDCMIDYIKYRPILHGIFRGMFRKSRTSQPAFLAPLLQSEVSLCFRRSWNSICQPPHPKKTMKEVIHRRCSQKTGVLSVLSSQTSPMTSQAVQTAR